MPVIENVQLPSGNTYAVRDADAQSKLTNVYTKGETYTRAEVQAAIAEAMKGGYVAVTTLPTASDSTMGHIYLVPGTTVSGSNTKIEYVTIRSGSEGAYTYAWEELGTTELNLENLGLAKGDGDMVLGESTSFTASKPAVNISGGTNDVFVKSYPGESGKLVTDSVPNVTSVGSASTWGFTMGTGNESTTLIISGNNGSAPTLGAEKTVATGQVSAGGSGSVVMIGLGSAVTANAVISVGSAELSAAPTITVGTNDKVKVAKYDDLELQKP